VNEGGHLVAICVFNAGTFSCVDEIHEKVQHFPKDMYAIAHKEIYMHMINFAQTITY
jgi:hypothetical protein